MNGVGKRASNCFFSTATSSSGGAPPSSAVAFVEASPSLASASGALSS